MGAEAQPPQRVALVAGGTGLTGRALMQLLLRSSDYTRVHALTRRPLPLDHPRLANRILGLEDVGPRLAGVRCNDAFCCLGAATGPRATPDALRKVDVDLVLSFARAALAAGATRLVVISAAGADSHAKKPFLEMKGRAEAALRELRFPALDLLQPGSVLGQRAQASPLDLLRLACMPLLNPLLRGGFEKFRGIPAEQLAAAMLGAARTQRRGQYAYVGRQLLGLAQTGRRSG
jgi:uncharacterized protein YbjT (DUF2867 family)